MTQIALTEPSLLRRTVVEVANLPDDDLVILLDIVTLLKQQRTTQMVEDIGRAARQRAMVLRDQPHDQLAAQFREVGEKIRHQAITNGSAIEGDWEGD
ncbi:MAG: hypothetical protein KJ063_14050 [Anaerolineae bacterium]|nr:hypothetical protein [Anaerolineae bacterium]